MCNLLVCVFFYDYYNRFLLVVQCQYYYIVIIDHSAEYEISNLYKVFTVMYFMYIIICINTFILYYRMNYSKIKINNYSYDFTTV